MTYVQVPEKAAVAGGPPGSTLMPFTATERMANICKSMLASIL
jgi:hypothetical protein